MIIYTIKIEETKDGLIDINATAPGQIATDLEALAAKALSNVIANFITEVGTLEKKETQFKRIGRG